MSNRSKKLSILTLRYDPFHNLTEKLVASNKFLTPLLQSNLITVKEHQRRCFLRQSLLRLRELKAN